jgi:hypothetical protein
MQTQQATQLTLDFTSDTGGISPNARPISTQQNRGHESNFERQGSAGIKASRVSDKLNAEFDALNKLDAETMAAFDKKVADKADLTGDPVYTLSQSIVAHLYELHSLGVGVPAEPANDEMRRLFLRIWGTRACREVWHKTPKSYKRH